MLKLAFISEVQPLNETVTNRTEKNNVTKTEVIKEIKTEVQPLIETITNETEYNKLIETEVIKEIKTNNQKVIKTENYKRIKIEAD